MWIISKHCLLNTDAITYISETTFETFAVCGDRKIFIAGQPIRDKIIHAMKNDVNFLEVE